MPTNTGTNKAKSDKKTRHLSIAAAIAEPRKLVSAQEVERVTDLRAETLYKMARAGVCPCYRRGVKKRGVLFCIEEVLQALKQPVQIDTKAM